MAAKEPDVLTGEPCPFCHQKTLTLMEGELEVPFFGMCFVFSMDCSSCKYHKADVEAAEEKEPSKFTFEISKEEDMKVRVVKSANGKVTIPYVGSIEPGEAANGYITNVEGVLNRIKKQVEFLRDYSDDEGDRKKAKNLLKKLTKVMWGQEKVKLIIEDPTGNSAIISDRAKKEKLKK
ncbi:MAG: ZPR1 zinc finger domain-containing protein [Nanoarchaeota archaeon]